MKKIQNKKGWIRLIEAFMAILLLISVLVIVIDYKQSEIKNDPSTIYPAQEFILRTIELNDSLREEIINSDIPLLSNETNFPSGILEIIDSNIPSNIRCVSKICGVLDYCELFGEDEVKTNIYTESIFISSIPGNYDSKQLKLFCWNI